jgi:Uma2 family endonuclease
MTAEAQIQTKTSLPVTSKMKVAKASYISWTTFQNRYLSKDDGYSYEWNDGTIEKSLNTMTIAQGYILTNLDDLFQELVKKHAITGKLIPEIDILLDQKMHRRPDVAYFTRAQIVAGISNQLQIPAFVVEIISPNDKAEKVKQKVKEYLEAGVEVVWNIFPDAKVIEVYKKNEKPVFCSDELICSAETVIPGFFMSVDEILKVPQI